MISIHILIADVWDLTKFQYPWPTATEAAIYRNFSPDDLQQNLANTPTRHAVFVQCLNGTPEEASNTFTMRGSRKFYQGVRIDTKSPPPPKKKPNLKKS